MPSANVKSQEALVPSANVSSREPYANLMLNAHCLGYIKGGLSQQEHQVVPRVAMKIVKGALRERTSVALREWLRPPRDHLQTLRNCDSAVKH